MGKELSIKESISEKITDYPIIDTDIHEAFHNIKDLIPYIDEPWKSLLAKGAWKGFTQPFAYWTSGGGGRADAKPTSGGPAGSDYELLKKQTFDLYNIKYGVLTGYFYPIMMSMQFEFATALASAYNDFQIDQWLNKDDRLLGSIQIAPQEPKEAAKEIDRLGAHPRMVQVMLPIATVAYGDPFYFPIFEAAERNNLVISMHHTVQCQGALGMGRYFIERHMLIPQGMMAQVISLYCNGIFDKFPNLKFAMLESGFTWLPHLLWRMDREYKSLRQEIPWVKKFAREYIFERVKFATQPTEDLTSEEFMKVIDLIGTDELLMFATDYPHFDFDSPLRCYPNGLDEDMKKNLLYRNAADLYNIQVV